MLRARQFSSHQEVLVLGIYMYTNGVRRDISDKNVGRRKYSINALQLRFMPDVYTPPTECIDNMVTSTIKRDTS